ILQFQNPTLSEHIQSTVSRHESFRLFATQNPGTGFFKGKREKLSESFLTRFRIIAFKSLPREEWEQILKGGELLPKPTRNLTEGLIVCHFDLERLMQSQDFREKTSYAQVSLRELLRVCKLLQWRYNNGRTNFRTTNHVQTVRVA